MRRFVAATLLICAFGFVGTLSGLASAGETGHYVSGGEGIKAATLPPPGFYWRLYNQLYTTNTLKDKNGDELDVGYDLNVYALVNRFVWISNMKILGANFGVSLAVPLVYTNIGIKGMGTDDEEFDLGDIAVEPLVLSWHGSRYDAAFGLSLYVPTGEYDVHEAASPGKDFWTGMATVGVTYYFDAEKSWSASILSRYEIHSKKGDTDVKPGNNFHFEWGIGKTVAKIWDVGLTGYCQWQVTDDSGSDVTWDKGVHDRIYAVGPEVSVFIPPAKLSVSLRSQWEFGAEDSAEGNITTLVLTKMF